MNLAARGVSLVVVFSNNNSTCLTLHFCAAISKNVRCCVLNTLGSNPASKHRFKYIGGAGNKYNGSFIGNSVHLERTC